jgi:hypothetical protein
VTLCASASTPGTTDLAASSGSAASVDGIQLTDHNLWRPHRLHLGDQLAQLGEHPLRRPTRCEVAGVEVAGVLAPDPHQGALPALKIPDSWRTC